MNKIDKSLVEEYCDIILDSDTNDSSFLDNFSEKDIEDYLRLNKNGVINGLYSIDKYYLEKYLRKIKIKNIENNDK